MVSEIGSTSMGRPPPAPRSELSQSCMTGIEGYMGSIEQVRGAGAEREVEHERYETAVADFRDRIGKAEASILARDKMLQELEARLRNRNRFDPDQSSSLGLGATRTDLSRTTDITGSHLDSGEALVHPTVPLLFDSSRHPLPVSVPRTGMPPGSGRSARSSGSSNVPRSPYTPEKRNTRGKRGDDAQVQLFRSGPAAPPSDLSSEGGKSSSKTNWPCILGAAGAGLLFGGGVGWLCAHTFFAGGTKALSPIAAHNVTVGGGAGPPVPWSVAAAGATSAGHSAGSTAAADAALKAAAGAQAGSAASAATAAGAASGSAAAAAAAAKALGGASAAALATPFVTPGVVVPYVTGASGGGGAITGAAVGASVGMAAGGAAGWVVQKRNQQHLSAIE
eukprot:Hpha_TRINITY_DN16150_c1_g3::TRINITY_DN16150_c1_g3_i1::g.3580::m.3580